MLKKPINKLLDILVLSLVHADVQTVSPGEFPKPSEPKESVGFTKITKPMENIQKNWLLSQVEIFSLIFYGHNPC